MINNMKGQSMRTATATDLNRAIPAYDNRHNDAHCIHAGFKKSELKSLFDLIQNPNDWKASFKAKIPMDWKEHGDEQILFMAHAAIEFFHADKATIIEINPIERTIVIESDGYQG